ncbi:hypothetical protein [Loktanella sp. Alg231-35]|uniref:hypothetical protein n=1 Tax=Loktanella sp. Alg231-35 TaxID=1922220 RepID=UPI0018FF7403|nr:hypothetical protein [Loktanella sp. Alg231-35]
MIASPGDVLEERNIIRDALHEWNDLNSANLKAVLLPVGWETHSSPELGERPQSLINRNVLEDCELLVGVFWTRIGTPTGEAESGTAEEIRKHVDAGKPAMVYFSTAPVAPQSLEAEQFESLETFKDWCKSTGLIEQYDNVADFSEKFRRQVQIIVRDNKHLNGLLSQGEGTESSFGTPDSGNGVVQALLNSLGAEASRLLSEAAKDRGGTILSLRTLGGHAIQTNGINFTDSGDRRSVARWEAALDQLMERGFVKSIGFKNEVFEVTDRGFSYLDRQIT